MIETASWSIADGLGERDTPAALCLVDDAAPRWELGCSGHHFTKSHDVAWITYATPLSPTSLERCDSDPFYTIPIASVAGCPCVYKEVVVYK